MKNLSKVFLLSILLIQISACTQDALLNNSTVENNTESVLSKKEAIIKFSEILSKATYSEPALRSFLKNQALLQKDNDHNVFYPLTKNEVVYNNKTFSQVLDKYAGSSQDLLDIEKSFPLLNIFIPDLTVFDKDLSVEKLDTGDKNIPIFSTGKFFVNGILVDSISEKNLGEFPIFHTFVVNESHRRVIKSGTRASNGNVEYGFADDAFDPQKFKINSSSTRVREDFSEITENLSELYNANNSYVPINEFPTETLDAFKKVGAGTGSLRPMMYYNLNKIQDFNSPDAVLDHTTSDLIYRMKVGKEFYTYLSQYKEEEFLNPFLDKDWYVRYTYNNSKLSYDFVVSNLWSAGNFTFKVNVVTGGYSQAHTIIIRPQDLFTLTLERGYKHRTWFSDARTRWRVLIDKIESKWIYPHKLKIDTRFSPWDPKSESYKRSIYVSLAGSNKTKNKVLEVTSTVMNKGSVSAGLNIPFTINGSTASLNITGGWESANTTVTKNQTTITISDKDREMGNNLFNFFGASPISEVRDGKVYLETTRYGCFDMCIIPVKRNLAQ